MMNKIILMGRMTADTAVKKTNSGKEYVNFTVAVDQFDRYFKKGSMILIEGSMHNDNYTDNNGVTHYGMSVRVTSAYFTGERKGNAEEPFDDEPEG